MKKRYKTLLYSSLFTLALGITSCEDYLDKNPDRQKLEDEIRRNTDYAKVDVELSLYYFIHIDNGLALSSPRRASRTMAAGTGTITAASSHSQASMHWDYMSHHSNIDVPTSVIYRSRDGNLPSMSNEEGPGGEVFFDVRRGLVSTAHGTDVYAPPPLFARSHVSISPTSSLRTAQLLSRLLRSRATANTLRTVYPALYVRMFLRASLHYQRDIRQGSDFYTVYVRPTSAPLASQGEAQVSHDDERLQDEVRFVKFSSISWSHDSQGFFYQVSGLP